MGRSSGGGPAGFYNPGLQGAALSLLSICQQVADETGFEQPATIVSNTEETAVRLLALAKRAVDVLSHVVPWAELRAEHTFTTVGAAAQTSATPIPSNFDYMIRGTCWNRSTSRRLAGPMTGAEWQDLQVNDTAAGSDDQKFTIRGGLFYIHPTPDAGDTVAYEYVINTPVESSDGTTAKATYEADTDVAKIPERLVGLGVKARFLANIGSPLADIAIGEYQHEVEKALLRENDAPGSSAVRFHDMPRHDAYGWDWRTGA